jgi:hypothetical protein
MAGWEPPAVPVEPSPLPAACSCGQGGAVRQEAPPLRAGRLTCRESPTAVNSERLSRALRDLERSANFIEQILNRPLDEFLNDDEAVYALRHAVIEAVETAVQIGLILLRETGARPASFGELFEVLGEGESSSRGISLWQCGGLWVLGACLCTGTGRLTALTQPGLGRQRRRDGGPADWGPPHRLPLASRQAGRCRNNLP